MLPIVEARSTTELQRCFPVMRELRPHLTLEKFLNQVPRQRQHTDYRLMFIADQTGTVVSTLGYRLSECLAWDKFLYIDDLVTRRSARGQGYAGLLLDWAIAKARLEGCDQVHLDSGHQRLEAHRLYAKHGFVSKSHHFSLVI